MWSIVTVITVCGLLADTLMTAYHYIIFFFLHSVLAGELISKIYICSTRKVALTLATYAMS